MTNKPRSRKHHYLPVNYLNGFTDSENGFLVYDKREDRFFPSNPTATFFENHLNTVEFPRDRSSDFLEDLYGDMEKRSWVYFDRIRNSVPSNPIDFLDKASLLLFLLFLHWRLPSNIPFIEQLSAKAFADNGSFEYFNLVNENGEKPPNDIVESIKRSSAFKKAFRSIVPFAPFHKNDDWAMTLNNWRFLYAREGSQTFIVGDNPIISEGQYDHDPIKCLNEFIFPVSGRVLLLNIHDPIVPKIPESFIYAYSTALIQRAQRFVASPDGMFLRQMVTRYKLYVKHHATHIAIRDLFEMLGEQ